MSITTDSYLDTDDTALADKVFSALDELLATFGFESPVEAEILRGSIRRKARAIFEKLARNDEVQARLRKMERALELAVIDGHQAGVDEKQAAAVSNLLSSLSEVPSACIRVGSLLILKFDPGTGSVVLVRSLSQLELGVIERYPEIQANPSKALAALALALDAVATGKNVPGA